MGLGSLDILTDCAREQLHCAHSCTKKLCPSTAAVIAGSIRSWPNNTATWALLQIAGEATNGHFPKYRGELNSKYADVSTAQAIFLN